MAIQWQEAKAAKRIKRDENGMFVIWIIGLSLGLLFFGVLMVDFWHVFTERRDMTDLADGAAVVGSQQIDTARFVTTGEIYLLNDGDNAYDGTVGQAVCNYLDQNAPDNVKCGGADGAVIKLLPEDSADKTSVEVDLHNRVHFLALGVLPDKSGRIAEGIDVTGSSTSRACQVGAGGTCL